MDPSRWQNSDWVAGVDGCPDGWIVVLVNQTTSEFQVAHAPEFRSILTLDLMPRVIAIDMPIGLPDRIEGPGRVAEQAVRKYMTARKSSVFSMVSRTAAFVADYSECKSAARSTSHPERGLSKQAFNILPKVREIDVSMKPELQNRVFECHPEVIFTTLNNDVSAPSAKKKPEGLAWRQALLSQHSIPEGVFSVNPKEFGKAARDDLVDAAACAATALRIASGTARRFPKHVTRDAKGLDIAIWA